MHWKTSVQFAKDVGEWAKLIALILAIVGLIGIYFPTIQRRWEILVKPKAWYYIGFVDSNRFYPLAYQHPAWNDGPASEEVLSEIPGQVIVTFNDELHIGRDRAGSGGKVQSVLGKNACLYVSATEKKLQPGAPRKFVWAEAVKVSC